MNKNVVKNGKNVKGVQTYYDKDKKKYFTENYQRPPLHIKFFAILMYINGLPFRRVGEIIGVDHTTVMKWLKKYSHMFDFESTTDKNMVYEDVEIDEMFSFIQKKTKKCTYGLQ